MKKLIIMLCALTGLAGAQQSSIPKPPPGVPPDAKLFNGHWYKVVFDRVDWPQAKQECERKGGQLAVIPDAATWAFIKKLTIKRVWLGATDEAKEGTWKWIDGTAMSFTAWDDGEPNNVNKKEHYLCRSPFGGWADTMGKWDGYSQWLVDGYVCQWKAAAEKPPSTAANAVVIEVATWDATTGVLTMKSQDRLRSFKVTPETAITLNGLKSKSEVIAPGQKVMSFTFVKDNPEALSVLTLEGVAKAASPAPDGQPVGKPHIIMKLNVDSGDLIRVQADKLWIEHAGGNLPHAMSINGVEWKPTWANNKSSAFNSWPAVLPSLAGAKVTVAKLNGRAKSVVVKEQPSVENNNTLTVRIDDGYGGASDLAIEIRW